MATPYSIETEIGVGVADSLPFFSLMFILKSIMTLKILRILRVHV